MTPAFQVQSYRPNQAQRFGIRPLTFKQPKEIVMKRIMNFINDESGMETLEYAVIAGLIAVVAVAVYATGGQWRTNLQNRLLGATNAS